MLWNDKRYHTLNYELKKTFGGKVIKLSLDGGFTCPNRDGLVGERGCLFCGEQGSGDFAANRTLSIAEQIKEQKKFLATKWPRAKYLAYFQNFTNTYAPTARLDQIYKEATEQENVVGLAIATRPDCLPSDVLNLLEIYAKKTYLWVELGLQTSKESTAHFLRRGYDLHCFTAAVQNLQRRNIPVVVHLILGLPGETKEDMLASVCFVANLGIWGLKLHLLHIQRDTDLYSYYREYPFELLTKEEYIHLVCDALEILPSELVIHRLTGDGNRQLLEAPKWSLHKLGVLSGIDQELKKRGTLQGSRFAK